MKKPFWETKTLNEMTQKEWESLCDGCGKCCLIKLEDEETKELSYTDVACYLLDSQTCKCKKYEKRKELVKDCIQLKPDDVEEFRWLPNTCAYRLIHECKSLPGWHYLICGDRNVVHEKKISVINRTVSETEVLNIAEHVVYWRQ